jgi:microcystin-dependent protein
LTTPARELTGVPGDMVQITAVNGATLTVSGAIGADITVANNAIARRWDTAVTNSANQAVNPVIISTALALENGLSVTFAGSDFRMGDYWLIPARAALNSQGSHIDWPMDDSGNYLTQLPNGIQRSYAPLAIVQCNNGRWSFESDARTISIPLSELNIKVIGADPCAPADTIHVDCNGQVGISTDTPSAKLDVETSTAMTGQDAIHAMANSNGIAIQAATNNNIAAIFKNNSTQPTLQLSNNGSGQALQTQGDVSLDGSLTISNIDSGSFSVLAAADKVPAGNSSGYLDASWLVKAIPAGAMLDFAGAEPPTGFLLCDGRAVSRTTYATLFAAIGVIWGAGDGSTTFNLPDFQRRVAMGSGGTGSNIIGNVVGGVGGVEKYTLGINDLPNHTHNGAGGGNNRFIVDSGYNGDGGAYTQGKYNSFSSTTGWVTNQVAHNAVSLVQPSAIVTKIIKY